MATVARNASPHQVSERFGVIGRFETFFILRTQAERYFSSSSKSRL